LRKDTKNWIDINKQQNNLMNEKEKQTHEKESRSLSRQVATWCIALVLGSAVIAGAWSVTPKEVKPTATQQLATTDSTEILKFNSITIYKRQGQFALDTASRVCIQDSAVLTYYRYDGILLVKIGYGPETALKALGVTNDGMLVCSTPQGEKVALMRFKVPSAPDTYVAYITPEYVIFLTPTTECLNIEDLN
jgi:hypothetical protein